MWQNVIDTLLQRNMAQPSESLSSHVTELCKNQLFVPTFQDVHNDITAIKFET